MKRSSGSRSAPGATTPTRPRTVVIGAGIAGLATAALLAREGHDVTVLERGARVGGRAGTLSRNGFRFDTGPSWYLMPRVFDHFFEMLGTSTEEQLDLRLLDPGYRVFSEPEGRGADRPEPVTVPAGRSSTRALFELLEPGSGAAFDAYLDSATETTEMAERYFLYNPFTSWRSLAAPAVLRALPRLAQLLLTPLRSFAAKRFQHPVLRQVLGYPAVFLGTNPKDAPAMYHLMSALDLDEGVRYPMGGFHHLVERLAALAREAGAEIVLGADVTEIETGRSEAERGGSPNGERRRTQGGRPFTARAVRWRDRDGVEQRSSADVVVSTADLHHTETRLLPEAARSYPERSWERQVSGPGAVLVLLGVRGELPELPHHSLFFTRDWDRNFDDIFGATPRIPDPASSYVCKPSTTDPGVAPEGHENLFVLVPIPADPAAGRGGADGSGDPAVERVADAAIDQISEWAGIPALRERIVVRHTIGPQDFVDDYHSWSGGMLGPAHVLRQSAMFRAQNRSKRVDNLFYAGATTAPGVGIPMCLISAELVVKHLRGDRSAGPLPAPAGRRSKHLDESASLEARA